MDSPNRNRCPLPTRYPRAPCPPPPEILAGEASASTGGSRRRPAASTTSFLPVDLRRLLFHTRRGEAPRAGGRRPGAEGREAASPPAPSSSPRRRPAAASPRRCISSFPTGGSRRSLTAGMRPLHPRRCGCSLLRGLLLRSRRAPPEGEDGIGRQSHSFVGAGGETPFWEGSAWSLIPPKEAMNSIDHLSYQSSLNNPTQHREEGRAQGNRPPCSLGLSATSQ
jgi:hypothetical protein